MIERFWKILDNPGQFWTNLYNPGKSCNQCLLSVLDTEKINFVTPTKTLGVTFDNQLKFSIHTRNVCKLINTKTYLLSKSISLFTNKFRPTLFKLFIQPHFDYCSTIYMYLANETDRERLSKCFSKSIQRLVNVNTFGLTLEQQHGILRPFKILSLYYRQFFRF